MPPFHQYARVVREMPPVSEVIYAVWGKDCKYDSEGDANPNNPGAWRDLQASLRTELEEEIDIYPLTGDKDLILIQATEAHLLQKIIQCLISAGTIQLVEDPS